MKFLPTTTLAYCEGSPQKKRFDFTDRPLALIAKATDAYKDSCSEVSPDVRALEFYACNHYYSRLTGLFTRNEKMPEWAVKLASTYHDVLVEQGERLMHYLLCIIVREARHAPTLSSSVQNGLKNVGGNVLLDFIVLIRGKSEMGAINNMLKNPPDLGAGRFVRGIEYLFDHGWGSGVGGSFGGKPWGCISRCLGDFLTGKTSLEMMVDTAYTLAHNNGPMFNKGMMYKQYSTAFKTILDVQRSGQIPELVKYKGDHQFMSSISLAGLTAITDLAYEHLPGDFGTYVDWYKVEECGSLVKYPEYKKMQDKKYPKKPVAPQATLFMGKKAIEVGTFEVSYDENEMEAETVKVFERITA